MSWIEIGIGDLAPGMAGDSGALDDLAANHDELYGLYSPPVMPAIPEPITETAGPRVRYRWRLRGNEDLHDVRVRVLLDGDGTATLNVGAVSASQVHAGAAAAYNIDVMPAVAGPVECSLELEGDPSLELLGAACFLEPSALAAGTLASGFRRAAGVWAGTADAVSSEHVQRLLRGPGQVLRDRPWPAFTALRDAVRAPKGDGALDWAASDSTAPVVVGRGLLPVVADRARQYTLDAYLSAGDATIQVGGWVWEISGAGWHATTVDLSPADYPVTATITPGAGTTARLEAVQIWRL